MNEKIGMLDVTCGAMEYANKDHRVFGVRDMIETKQEKSVIN